ncbi:hypothetical protein K525DRAFT_262126 [Schizophyllum commune Loenen D]|nr:hypothetical protein K525DRAFT_262126 [Schizophyllum commune Loenen D]
MSSDLKCDLDISLWWRSVPKALLKCPRFPARSGAHVRARSLFCRLQRALWLAGMTPIRLLRGNIAYEQIGLRLLASYPTGHGAL